MNINIGNDSYIWIEKEGYLLSKTDVNTAIVLNMSKVNANVLFPILVYYLEVLTGHLVTHWLVWRPYIMEMLIRYILFQ